jgi:hypothetical protein
MSIVDPTSNKLPSLRSLPATDQWTLWRAAAFAFLSCMTIAAAVWAASWLQLRSEELAITTAVLIFVATYVVMAIGKLPGSYLDRAAPPCWGRA